MERATQGTTWRDSGGIGERQAARFLGNLQEPAREELLRISTQRQYSPGEKIFVEGARDDYLAILTSGHVKVTGMHGSRRDVLIAIRVSGDVIGEMAVIAGVPRSATVTACDDVEARVVQGQAIRHFLVRYPEAALEIARLNSHRLRKANLWRVAFASAPVRVRLAWLLAELAEDHGAPIRSCTLIRLDLTQAELGAFIGARQSAVHKALARFRDEGIITTGCRRMEVVNVNRLREIGGLPKIVG